jgi:hypothetical protein
VRATLSAQHTFRDAVRAVDATLREARTRVAVAPTHEELLLRSDHPRGLWSRPVAFRCEDRPPRALELPGLDAELVSRTATADRLALDVRLAGDEPTAIVTYDAAEFDDAAIEALIDGWTQALEADPDAPLGPVARDAEPRLRGFRLGWRLRRLEERLRAHPELDDIAVRWNAEEGAIEALVVVPRAPSPAPSALDRWLAQEPDWVLPAVYLEVEELGRDGWRRPLPEPPGSPERERAEAQLAAIWEEVLRTGPIGRADSFFRRGGTLCRGASMLARSALLGAPIAARQLLATPTIAELAPIGDEPPLAAVQPAAWPERLRIRLDEAGRVVEANLPSGGSW